MKKLVSISLFFCLFFILLSIKVTAQSTVCNSYNQANPFIPIINGSTLVSCGNSTTLICNEINSRWYDAPTGNNVIGSGNTLIVTPLANTTYYVQREINLTVQTINFNYTGTTQQWTVPNGVTSINVLLKGAAGISGISPGSDGTGGLGGQLQATIAVTPGQILNIFIGGTPTCLSCAGWNGGGAGQSGGLSGNTYGSGGGGGASDIRIGGTSLSQRVLVAAGGGGGGCFCYCCTYGNAGAGGGLVGGNASYPFGTDYSFYFGFGATQSAGGVGGAASNDGLLGLGGNGQNFGGGGGGGYYGGGGGSNDMGGGGGSSYAISSATNVVHSSGVNAGNGFASISYTELCTSNRQPIQVSVNSIPSPANPTSNSPQCQTVTLTRTGSPSGNVTWYWQGTDPNGTSTNLGSGSTYSATSSGNYYIRARNSSGCWSSNSASTFVQVSGFPSAPPSISSSALGCGQIALTQNNLPPQGVGYYWQGTNANGTSTATSGNTYIATSSGNYYQRALNSSNCWSQTSSSINVNVNSAPSINNLYQSACNSFTWVNGVTYNSSTAAQLILDNAAENGCDSIIQLNLTVHPIYSVTDLINACDTHTWINGVTYTQDNNSAVYLLQSAYGCDSLVTLNLTFGDDSDTTFIESSALDAYVLNDITYDESGIFFQNLQNKFGCDSVIQLNIFIESSSIENTDFSNELFRVYPNPNQTGYFQIACDSDYAIESVKNIYGQNVPAKLDFGLIDLSGFSSGFYLVTLKIAGKNYALKLIYY
jgi:hypothetical protein